MITHSEGNLTFSFPAGWTVAKYDDSKFFRSSIIPTNADLKAVDFVVSSGGEQNNLLLIEVKDFRNHRRDNLERQKSGDLVDEIVRKTLHTLSGLYTASYLGTTDLEPLCKALKGFPSKIEIVLFMEEDKLPESNRMGLLNQKTYKEDMRLLLRRKLLKTLNINPRILDTTSVEIRDGWTVV